MYHDVCRNAKMSVLQDLNNQNFLEKVLSNVLVVAHSSLVFMVGNGNSFLGLWDSSRNTVTELICNFQSPMG
jgi:hypothetical protein